MRLALLTACFSLAAAAFSPARAAPDPAPVTVDVVAEAEPMRDVLRRLQQEHGLNYVVSEDALAVAKKVTVHLEGVPLSDAVQAICAAVGLAIEVQGPILVIVPREFTRRLPEVREGLPDAQEQGSRPQVAKQPTGRPLPPVRRPGPRPANLPVELMATGDVLEVDLPNRRLQLGAGGVKRDFYLPGEHEADPYQRSARLGQALMTLAPGSRVALLYRREGDRSVITNLIGGDRVGSDTAAYAPRPAHPQRDAARRPPPAPRGTRTAPEATQMPDGVLVGRYAGRDGELIKVRLPNDEIQVCSLPPAEDAERRKKVLAVIEKLEDGARVLFRYEVVDGQRRLLDSGITEVR